MKLRPGEYGFEEAIRSRVEADPERARVDALALIREAKEAKRLAERHRRRAGRRWAEFYEFQRNLEALGIKVVIEGNTKQPQFTNATEGGTSERIDRSTAAA